MNFAENFKLNARQAIFRIARRFRLDLNLQDSDCRVEQLSPDESVCYPSARFLTDQIEKITGCPFGLSVQTEINRVKTGRYSVHGVRKFTVRDVILTPTSIIRGIKYKSFQERLSWHNCKFDTIDVDNVSVRSSFVGCYYFGHWLRDDLATNYIDDVSDFLIFMKTPEWPDKKKYSELLNLNSSTLDCYRAKKCIFYDDIHQNLHKRERLLKIRDLIEKSIPNSCDEFIYLARGPTASKRKLVNEAYIIENLSAIGFRIVYAEENDNIVGILKGAKIVVSIEGSQLSHALHTISLRGSIVVIQPPDRFFNSHMDWANLLGIRYAFVVGEKCGSDFSVRYDDLLRTIELCI